MKPLELRIYNFRSIKDSQIFRFPQKAGLYFLYGKNLSEPRLEANGAGKSTIWEAICWLFFGKTSRGLKAGDVANWEVQDNTSVSLDYDVGGLFYTVKRTWNPNSWTLLTWADELFTLDVNDPGNLFHSHLKLTYNMFLHCCYMAQGQPMFLDLKAVDKASLFSDVMDLDKWLTFSGNALELSNKQDSLIRKIEKEVASLQGRLESYKEEDFSVQIKEWEDNVEKEIDEKDERHVKLSTELQDRREDLKEINKKISSATTSLEISKDKIYKLTQARNLLQDDQLRLSNELTKIDVNLEALKNQIEWFIQTNVCTHCKQDISHQHKRDQKAQLDEEIKLIKEKEKKLQMKIAGLSDEINFVEKSLCKLDQESTVHRDRKYQEERNRDRINSQIDMINREMDQLEKQVESLLGKENPFLAKQKELGTKKHELRDRIQQTQEELDETFYKQRLYQYWIKGFKDLRLHLIAETLQQLEVEVNSCLSQLGLVDWQLQFDVSKENKSGTVNRGFNVTVLSPHNKKPVPWEGWSGGESQRLRIAAEMGLANLIRSTTGATFDLEAWDEPTQWMSGQGVNDLLESLSQRSRDECRRVWIVDHRSLGYGAFDGIFTVVKNEEGTKIM